MYIFIGIHLSNALYRPRYISYRGISCCILWVFCTSFEISGNKTTTVTLKFEYGINYKNHNVIIKYFPNQ